MVSARYSDLAGKHVVVSGGCHGIGRAISLAFAKQGSRVSILDVDVDAGQSIVQSIDRHRHCDSSVAIDKNCIEVFPVDVCESSSLIESLKVIQEQRGAIDVLVPNAGYDPRHQGLKITEKEWDDLFALNVRHYFVMCREVLPSMIERGRGVIIMTASHTIWETKPELIAYNSTKSAIAGLVRSLATSVGPYGIRVNAVAPGWTMTERQLRQWVTDDAIDRTLHEFQDIPLKIIPEHISEVYLFLASQVACAITRQIIVADAGQSKH